MTCTPDLETTAALLTAKRVAIAAPTSMWETQRYHETIELLRRLHPGARIFHPATYLTPELEWDTEEEELPRVNHHGEIAWDSIICTADVLYVLRDERGNVGKGTASNITRAKQHGVIVCRITGWNAITDAPQLEVLQGV